MPVIMLISLVEEDQEVKVPIKCNIL